MLLSMYCIGTVGVLVEVLVASRVLSVLLYLELTLPCTKVEAKQQ
jgi:hypothetical protein